MSDYFANKFISTYSLTFLLFFWIALLLFGVYFWEYHESGNLEGLFHYVSTIVLMIIITYRETQQGKKRIHDKKLLSVTHSTFKIDKSGLLLASDEKFLRLSNSTFWAILILLVPSAILLVYNIINGIVEYDSFIFLALGMFLIHYIFKDIQLIKQRLPRE